MTFQLKLTPIGRKALHNAIKAEGTQERFAKKVGISRSTLWAVKNSGIMSAATYEKVKTVSGELDFKDK